MFRKIEDKYCVIYKLNINWFMCLYSFLIKRNFYWLYSNNIDYGEILFFSLLNYESNWLILVW